MNTYLNQVQVFFTGFTQPQSKYLFLCTLFEINDKIAPYLDYF